MVGRLWSAPFKPWYTRIIWNQSTQFTRKGLVGFHLNPSDQLLRLNLSFRKVSEVVAHCGVVPKVYLLYWKPIMWHLNTHMLFYNKKLSLFHFSNLASFLNIKLLARWKENSEADEKDEDRRLQAQLWKQKQALISRSGGKDFYLRKFVLPSRSDPADPSLLCAFPACHLYCKQIKDTWEQSLGKIQQLVSLSLKWNSGEKP